MRDYFRSRSTMEIPPTVDNFRQHLLHHDTSFIAFSMNELKMNRYLSKYELGNHHYGWTCLLERCKQSFCNRTCTW